MNIIEIKDFEAKELDIYARLSEGQLLNRAKPDKGIFIAESPKVIERALDAGYEPISCLIEKKHIEGEGKVVLEKCDRIYQNRKRYYGKICYLAYRRNPIQLYPYSRCG